MLKCELSIRVDRQGGGGARLRIVIINNSEVTIIDVLFLKWQTMGEKHENKTYKTKIRH